MKPPTPADIGRQGNYAGAVTRLVAFAADIGASWGIFTLAIAGLGFAINLVTGKQVNLTSRQILALIAIIIWEFVYFAYQWALGGKTMGMALLGIASVFGFSGYLLPMDELSYFATKVGLQMPK